MAIEKSITGGEIVGTIKEFNLKREDNVSGLKAWSSNDKKMMVLPACSRYVKKNWRDSAMIVEVNGVDIEIDLGYDVKQLRFKDDGTTQTDYSFSGLDSLVNNYVMGQTRVCVKVTLDDASKVSKVNDEFYWESKQPVVTYSSISSSNVSDVDSIQIHTTGKLLSMKNISKDGEPTGDVSVSLGHIGGSKSERMSYKSSMIMDKEYTYEENGQTFTITAEQFKDNFNVKDSVEMFFTIVAKMPKVVPQPTVTAGAFGFCTVEEKKTKPTYEYHIIGCKPLIKSDKNYINDDEWEKLEADTKAITDIRVQNAINKAKENANNKANSSNSVANATVSGQTPFGNPFNNQAQNPFGTTQTTESQPPFGTGTAIPFN